MRENKNIERLFQEKFKDFEVSPPDFIWENIQEKLHPKEKKRRVIPFWFKTAGIAASFVAVVAVVFFNMDNDFKSTNKKNNNTVVNSDANKENNTSNQNVGNPIFHSSDSNKNKSKFNTEIGINSKSNALVNDTKNTHSTNRVSDSKTASKLNRGSLQNSNTYKSNNGFVSNDQKQTNSNASFKKNNTSFNHSSTEIVATRNNKKRSFKNNLKSNSSKSDPTDFNDLNFSKNNSSNSGITDINTFNKFNTTKSNNSNSGLTDINTFNKFNTIKSNNSNSGITDINTFNKLNTTKSNDLNSGITDINTLNSSELNSKTNTNNIGVLAATNIEKTNASEILAFEEVKIDTITLATLIIEENPMEKLLREKETNKVADEKEKWSKWALNSYVSPVFFNSFTTGSPLSEEFASNEKVFNNSTSYGVGVAYNLNKRLSIKSGVSNLNLDFDTENIAFYSTFEDQSRIANTNIERNSNGKYLVIKHERDVSKNAVENQILQSSQNLGNLNQKTQYIEVPIEMSYALINKKFGVAIKGGMSTLFLTENIISIKATDGNMQIGKASNLNDVHFSSNLGLGFSYNFMKNFQLNLEPTLKYQINTFNKNAAGFTPYVIGVNTGISYKF